MKKGITKFITTCILAVIGSSFTLNAQSQFKSWTPIFEKEISITGKRVIIPNKYKTFHVSNDFKSLLFSAPNERNVSLQNSTTIIDLPMPNGETQKFKVVEAPIMESELATQFPNIKTFNVMGLDEQGAYGKLDWTEFGFHGMIFSANGRVFIDPYSRNNTEDYITYYTSDFSKAIEDRMIPECGASDISTERVNGPSTPILPQANIFAGTVLRTYRFAVACTGEYAVAATGVASPTTAQILSVVTTSVNRVDGVYETEASIRLVLVANETAILFGNAATDPFTGNNNAGTLINESQTVITNNIGSANYDIGHTFSTGGGGLAGLGVVCTSTQKARGITGSPSPVGDAYDIDYVAHEVGHQFSGNHSYNQCTGNATQNPGTMVEPGGGVTIMGYAGICATADNIAMNSIPYFHTISFDEIMTFSNTGNGNVCPTKPSTGNNPPVVTGSANYTIPRMTPFTLTGSATDPEGDVLTYSWEEIDNNSTAHAVGTAAPYFRSLVPVSTPSRTFPRLSTILTGATSNLGEYLPNTAQTLNFRLTARDNKMGGGGVHYAGNQVIIASSGPFEVTYPNATGITWASGSTQTVTWNVNSTNTAPVSCANVRILLSTDGGNTFPTVILATTPNDGTQAITVPSYATNQTTCRIKIEAVGNIFFDISNNNFTITATTSPIAGVAITQTAGTNPMCPGASATFSATPTNGGTAPTYQWQVNGANVGTNSSTYTTTSLTNGQVVTCVMTSNLGGVVGNPATSNSITMVVGSTTPSVVIAGPSVLCAGASATYTATPTNGGSAPTYQWQVNAVNAGTNSATFTTSSLTNGQTVTCIMTSNAGCQATPTVTSNTITVTVNSAASTPFVENFEGATFPPTGWILQNADNGAVAWGTAGAKGLVRRAAAGNTGSATGSAGIECYNYNTDTTQVDNLISVPVSLVGAATARMTFKRAYKYYNDATNPNNYHDELRVYISSDCGTTFGPAAYYKKGVQLASNGTSNATFTPAVAADWDTDTLDLTAYVNQSVIVKFEVTNRYGNNLYLDDINITSTTTGAIPVANFTSAATKCASQAIQFTDASTNSPTSWAWSTTPSTGVTITSPTSQNPTITFSTAGTYTVSHTATNASGTSPSYTQAVVVNPRPTVVSTSTTVCNGQSATITASGANTYSWNTGATTAGLTINPATATTTYTVTGTTTATGCTNTANGVITVNNLPTVVSTSTTVCQGSSATITASGANTYVWNTGATTAGLTINPVTATTTYTVTGTNTVTTCSNTATGTITMNARPTVTATSVTACQGSSATITASGANTYVWNTGATTAGLTINPVTATTTYTVTGTAANTCTNTATGTITATNAPVMTSATSANICSGNAVNIPLTSNIASTYSWIAAANANVTGESTTAQTGTTINNTLTNTSTTTQTVTYSVTPTATAGGCVGAVQTVTVSVIPAPTMTNATTANVCSGTPLAIALTSNVASTYSWIAANNAQVTGESTTAQTGATINNTLINTSASPRTVTYSVTPTSTAGSCVGTTQVISVTVNLLPTVTATSTPAGGTVCSGASVTLTGGGANTYVWTGGVTNGTPFAATATTTYTVTGTTTATGCSNTATRTITVNPLPVMTNATTANVCSGTAANIALTSDIASNYSWIAAANANVTGESTTAQATATINNTLTNTTAATQTVTYSVTPTATTTGCVGATQIVSVTVVPAPTMTSATTASVCSGTPLAISLTSNIPSTYSWIAANNVNVTGESTIAQSSATINNTLGNTSGAPRTVTYSVTPTSIAGSCAGTMQVVTVTVNILPTVVSTSTTVCQGSSATITASGAATYSWNTGATSASLTINPVTATTTYTVTGTAATSCTNTATGTITMNALPTVTATSTTVCQGTSATITAGGAASYSWNTGATTAGLTINPVTATTTYTVTGTAANTCTNTATGTITMNALPNVTVNSPSTCSGVATTLTANGASSYSWSTAQTGASISVSPTSNASYTVTGTDANGCVNTAVSNVNVTAAPNVTVNSQTICAGESATLTGNGATTYSWNTGASSASITVSPTGTTSYTVTGSNGPGCQNTAIATVTVNNLPSVNATANPASASICEGAQITLSGSGANSYTWTGGITDATAFSPLNSATYTVTGTDANGCSNTTSISVTVNPLPIITVNSPSTCAGVATTLTASGASTYSWSNSASGSSISVNPTSNSSYTVTGTDANGCINTAISNVTITSAPNVTVNSQTICAGQSATLTGSGASTYSWNTGDATASITVNPTGTTTYTVTGSIGAGCENTAIATVTVNNLPVINTTSSASSTVCSGSGVTLTATGGNTYTWNTGDATDIISVNPSTTTTYTATGVDANGCSNTSSITVNVFPVNTPTVSQAGNTLTASGAVSYQWYLDGNILPGETSSTLTATQNGSYTVVAVDANGCSATSAAVVVNGIGINEVTNTVATNIYPNPTTGVFAIEITLDAKNDYTIEISDVLGRVLYSEKVITSKVFNKNYDFSNESNGVYFISIQGTDKSKTVKRMVLNK